MSSRIGNTRVHTFETQLRVSTPIGDRGGTVNTGRELIVFWRMANDLRCVVVQNQAGAWQLKVLRKQDAPVLIEEFADATALFQRARSLRLEFQGAQSGISGDCAASA